jgi:N-methylhydantoinase A/oxoprolinase/acetone carboxylase beta subunit
MEILPVAAASMSAAPLPTLSFSPATDALSPAILRTPAIDIAEVGAGGGSILAVDDARALHVGPHSAGAAPGPVCYGNGGTAATLTLTDANVTLGYLAQDRLLSGLRLDALQAQSAISAQIASALGVRRLRRVETGRSPGTRSTVRIRSALARSAAGACRPQTRDAPVKLAD